MCVLIPSRSDPEGAFCLFEHLDVDGDLRVSPWELARFLPSVSDREKMSGYLDRTPSHQLKAVSKYDNHVAKTRGTGEDGPFRQFYVI